MDAERRGSAEDFAVNVETLQPSGSPRGPCALFDGGDDDAPDLEIREERRVALVGEAEGGQEVAAEETESGA